MRLMKLSNIVLILVLFSLVLAGCQSNTPTPENTQVVPTSPPVETPLPQPTASPTIAPARSLAVCLTSEPQTLYLYGSSSRSMWSVLEAIYDGPIDARAYSTQPVIVEKIPTLADGDAQLSPVTARPGDAVVDVDGNLVALQSGTRVLPAGCSSADCAITYDGQSELSMDQLVVRFKLLPGLTWSDGAPLTAQDSAYSYVIASDPATPTSKYLTDRTVSYKALDEQTIEWTGMPGFFEQRFSTFFWVPLPKHVLGDKSAEQLLADQGAARAPLGWGPYVIQEWTAGDHITLQKNPNYFRAAEGLPKFDTLVFRFAGEAADGDMNALLAGECDVVDQNAQFLEMFPGLVQRETENKLKLHVGQGPEWEHLDFGIRPASYDDGYNPGAGDRMDFFGDARTRQAFAYCIDRAALNANFLYNRSAAPASFVPASHPLTASDLQTYPYDPAKGQALLDEVGWRDSDGDPQTPRTALGVSGIPDGTPFSITYATSEAALRQQVAQSVSGSLEACGIDVNVQASNPGTLFSPGPDGPVFGRKFDLVQFSWEAGARPNCSLYASAKTPGSTNYWIGANVSGYSNAEYDAACAAADWSRDPQDTAASQRVQALFASELPAIPLYSSLKIALSRADLCGLEMDVTARSIFWNLEAFDYGGCQ